MPRQQSLTENIKQEVLAELNRSNYNPRVHQDTIASIKADVLSQIEAEQEALEARQKREAEQRIRLGPKERELLKWEILQEIGDNPTGYYSYQNVSPSAVDRAVIENIKNELLAEMGAARYGRTARPDGWRDILSDRSIDRRINQQYRDLRSLRGDIRRGLEAVRDTERRLDSITDPVVRDAVAAIINEARQEGISLNQVINRLNIGGEASWSNRVAGWFTSGAGRGFLGGIGTALVLAMLFPTGRGSLRNIGIKMMEGGLDLADQTRSAFGKAREGFEDMIAEANFNTLQESEAFEGDIEDPSSTETPENLMDDHPPF